MQDFSTISICLSADERYIWHLVETIWSIRKVSSARKTDVYVLLDCITEKSFYEVASEIVRFSTKTMSVIPINVNKAVSIDKKNISVTSAITYASYARIFLPEIFPKLSKILWLDCDLIVMKPLDEFWDIDVTGKYAAAVDDFTMENNITVELKECGVGRYFNAGVMLFNLDKIRNDRMNRLCKNIMYSTKPRFQDQTILNSCYRENVIWLSPRFNLHYTSYSNPEFAKWALSTFKERYKCSGEDPTIVHFTGIGTKPWQKDTPFYLDDYLRNTSEAKQFVQSSAKSMFARISKDLKRYEPIVKFYTIGKQNYIPEEKDRNLFVCMTSYPARIEFVSSVVKNMLSQTIVPDKVFVTLSKLEFPRREKSLPPELRRLGENEKVEIRWTNDNPKTMKKLLPVLNEMHGRDLIVIIDDDIIFQKDFIEKRLNDFYKFGEAFGISSNDGIEGSVSSVVSGAGSMIERKMLDNWEDFADRNVIRTYEDDWMYMFIMKMNGYQFVACSEYVKNEYEFKGFTPSKCYNTRHTIDVMAHKYAELKKNREK